MNHIGNIQYISDENGNTTGVIVPISRWQEIAQVKSRKERVRVEVILEPAEEGGFNVTVPALDGCFTQGDTEEEALDNAKEAILCYFEGLKKISRIQSEYDIKVKELEISL